jgi:uncharacterized short protein YbdD (DUF466 family)
MLGEREGRKLRTRAGAVPSLRPFRRFLAYLRRIAGMPDYAAHVEHFRRCHPHFPVPTERQFFEDFIRARYGDGPTRCC